MTRRWMVMGMMGLRAAGQQAPVAGSKVTVIHVLITQHGLEMRPDTVKSGTVAFLIDNQTPLRADSIEIGAPGLAVASAVEASVGLPEGRMTKRVTNERTLRPGQYSVWLKGLPKVSTRLTVVP